MRFGRALPIFSCLLTMAGVPFLAQAQSAPIRIDPSGENNSVQLLPLDARTESTYARFFRSPADQQLKPFSLVLRNNSSQSIVAITLIWTIATPDGPQIFQSRVENGFGGIGTSGGGFQSSSGSSSSVRIPLPPSPSATPPSATGSDGTMSEAAPSRMSRPVASGITSMPAPFAAGSTMLVSPGRFVFPELGAGGGSGDNSRLAGAIDISVLVDAVAMADGTVLGPDQSGTLDALTARNTAIEGVVSAVRIAQQSGQDPIAALEQLANARPTRENAAAIMLQSRIARGLLHSPIWEKQLHKMEAMPLPNFHR